MVKQINLAVIGPGLVGTEFLSQLSLLRLPTSTTLNLILIARSSTLLLSPSYTPLSIDVRNFSSSRLTQSYNSFDNDILPYLLSSPSSVILIDMTSSAELAEFYPKILSSGKIHIATPNKKPFSSSLPLFQSIKSSPSLVYHESTVGAGLPILSTLNDLLSTGDSIVKVEGIFSGTLSYIFNTFSTPEGGDLTFSEVVKEAKEKGYTEPDPRDDLNGMDVARKLTIIARLAGLAIDPPPTSFSVESLIPDALQSVQSGQEFIQGLPAHDREWTTKNEAANSENRVLRYVGSIDFLEKSVKVGLATYPTTHPFASLQGSDNIVAFHTERYGTRPLIIQGAGAGAAVTAMGILSDVLKIVERLKD